MKSLMILSIFVYVCLSFYAQPSAKEKKELENELIALNEGFAREPYQMGYIFDRAFVFVRLERWEEAIADFTMLLHNEPERVGPQTHAFVFHWRGRIYFELAQLDKAIADFSSAIQLHPKSPLSYFYRGMCRLIYDNFEQGCADYQAAIANGLYDTDLFKGMSTQERASIKEFFAECVGGGK